MPSSSDPAELTSEVLQRDPESRDPETGSDLQTVGSSHPTRVSAAFVALLAGSAVLILLLVFILENTRRVAISFVGLSWRAPLGVALLLAAVAGALILGLAGGARVLQLRLRLRRTT